uniref:Uncharacterized protein n=1 Tax=Rhizophora mucronata TaxID=61149 RepID=A0A2P2QCW8_RHIMU
MKKMIHNVEEVAEASMDDGMKHLCSRKNRKFLWNPLTIFNGNALPQHKHKFRL